MTNSHEDRQRLAATLQTLRLDTGLSTPRLAKRLGWSQSKVSKTELGRTLPSPADVDAWARVTGASREVRDELVAIADRADYQATEIRRALAPGRRKVQEDIQHLEAAASVIRVFAPVLVVGLAQTRAYAEAVFRIGRRLDPPEQSHIEAVEARLSRQAVLNVDKRFYLLMGEAALRRRLVPPREMRTQLEQLLRLSKRANITLGVIPFDATESVHQYHGFAVIGDTDVDDESVVRVPTLTRSITVREPREVGDYVAHFEALRGAALEGDVLREFLREVIAGLPID